MMDGVTHTRLFGCHVPITSPQVLRVELDAFGAIAAQSPQLLVLFAKFGPNHPVLTNTAAAAVKQGVHPVVTLEPRVPLAEIVAGAHDLLLARWAAALAAVGDVSLRLAHEMNGDWYPWSGTPETYVAAWRRIRGLFAILAPTVEFIWCPNRRYNAASDFLPYWPDHPYVDRLGLDAYNMGGKAVVEVLDDLQELRELAPELPLGIIETGCNPHDDRGEWWREFWAFVDWTPVSWIVPFYGVGGSHDWRWGNDPPAVEAFRTGLRRWVG